MTIERDGRVTFACCDTCSYSEEYDTFMEAVDSIKQAQWKVYLDKASGLWRHICPDCLDKARKEKEDI